MLQSHTLKRKSVDSDSRTRTVGRKRSTASIQDSTSVQASTKRRRRSVRTTQESNPMVGTESPSEFVPFSSLQGTDFANGQMETKTSEFGSNRLRTGFLVSRRMQRSQSHPGTPDDSDSPSSIQNSANQGFIHDLDTTDDDGGITLNIQDSNPQPIVISDDENSEIDDGQSDLDDGEIRQTEVREPYDAHSMTADEQMHVDAQVATEGADESSVSFVIDPTPSKPRICLRDLTSDELEQQIRYVFWHLQRDQIDLNRPARCLHCQSEGHIDSNCPEKTCPHCGLFGKHEAVHCPEIRRCDICRQPGHNTCSGLKNTTIPCDLCSVSGHAESDCLLKYYPRSQLLSSGKKELWISCCSCASKSHLVGDCPQSRSSKAARWSLRNLDTDQVVNLSVQKGVEALEKAAQNRGLRPEGLRIRGRADRYRAEISQSDSSETDELEHFFSHPPAPRNDKRQASGFQPSKRFQQSSPDAYRPRADNRYDRYAAPTGSDNYRPPRNVFYTTDSFGRPRSRSPLRLGFHTVRRSPSPSTSSNTYRSKHRPENKRPTSPPAASNIARRHPPTATKPQPGLSIQLPTRKGSNPNLKDSTSSNAANLPPKPPGQADKSRWTAHQRRHNGLTKTERRQKTKNKKDKDKPPKRAS